VVGALLASVAGIAAWVGWLTVCPALGFPTLGTAAMFNRVLVPREDPGFWLGWGVLLIGLAAAAVLYISLAGTGRFRPSVASGTLYGVVCWLVAGAIVMPLLGLALPAGQAAAATSATPPDPMVGSFMMLHLGTAAPIAALVAWVMFGAVLGGTSQVSQWSRGMSDAERRQALTLAGGVAVLGVLVSAAVIAGLRLPSASASATSARTLATGPVEALPPGADFVSVIDLIQAPGATLGPHAHVAGFAYDRRGVETLDFSDGTTVRVGPGEGGFMGMQVRHAHVNADRVPAAMVALLIVVAVVALSLILIRGTGRAARFAPAALMLLIAASVLGVWNPWSNDWLFLSVRPVSAHGAAMPLPTSSRVYESPDFGALPPGPYTETLQEITLVQGTQPFEVGSTGVVVLLGLDGSVHLESADGTSQIGAGGATLVRTGSSVRITDAGDAPAHVLSFSVAPRH
jgi:hypothetical protein